MLKYLKKYWFFCLLAPLFMAGEVAMDLIQPDMMADIVDNGVLGANVDLIITVGVKMILTVVAGGLCGVLSGVFANLAGQSFGNDLRKDVFSKIMHLSFQQTDKISTGSLVTRLTNDVTQVQQMVMMTVRGLVRNSVMFLGGIYMLYRQSPKFALVAACGLPFVVAAAFFFLRKTAPLFAVVQKKLDGINHIMQETVAGARVVKAYVKEEYELGRFDDANDALCRENLRVQNFLAFMGPCMNIVLNLCVVAVILVGGYTAKAGGTITPGNTMAAITYLAQILHGVTFMANIFQTFSRAKASADRINEVLHSPEVIENGSHTGETNVKGAVEFRNVSFSYPGSEGQNVLENISFRLEPGQTLAIIGATGSGKSSLAHLIPRFYDVTGGEVLVDGVNIMDIRRDFLRKNIAIVLQDTVLFSNTIENNIKYADLSASDEAMVNAAEMSHIRRYIEGQPKKYQTYLKQAGAGLSHGQRQLMAIARAVLADPKILILDEATSSVDTRTEKKIQDAMVRLMKNRTSLIIAHRLSTIRDADKIVVMDQGRVAETGSHEQLLAQKGKYYELYMTQFAGNQT